MITKVSEYVFKTLREDPAEAEVLGHRLLLRAGYIRRLGAGIFTWLPLGLRVRQKIEQVIREEMAATGAFEVYCPALLPADLFKQSGRWDEYGDEMFRLQDRRRGDYLLAPTHEEAFTQLMKEVCDSYRDLPRTIYQIQDRYRDEARPRAGLLRGREFSMKDAYSFDLDQVGLEKSYQAQRAAYERIFRRLDIEYVIVNAHAGAMGGSASEEFLHPTEIGEDTFVMGENGYAANAEAYRTPVPPPVDWQDLPPAQLISTPGVVTIADVIEHAKRENLRIAGQQITPENSLKCLLFEVKRPNKDAPLSGVAEQIVAANAEVIALLIPGDREVDMKRAEVALAPLEIEPASDVTFAKYPALIKGSMGPGVPGIFYCADPRLAEGTAWVTGGNEPDKHRIGVVVGRDFTPDCVLDAAQIKEGDLTPDGSSRVKLSRGIEIGHVFQLGLKYSQALGLNVLDRDGKSKPVFMGSYGIGVTRLLAILAEKNADEKGLIWPAAVAPFDLHVVLLSPDNWPLAEQLQQQLPGWDLLVDDRPKLSPGAKFADAELLGIPRVLVIGSKAAEGIVELWDRPKGEKTELTLVQAIQLITAADN